MRSATLSGWPSETLSEVNRYSPLSRMAWFVLLSRGSRAARRWPRAPDLRASGIRTGGGGGGAGPRRHGGVDRSYRLRVIGSPSGRLPPARAASSNLPGPDRERCGAMARIVDHLPLEALEGRYRAARDVTEARHAQAIWLLARGRTFLEVAQVLASRSRRCWPSRRAGSRSWRPATTPTGPRRSATGGG